MWGRASENKRGFEYFHTQNLTLHIHHQKKKMWERVLQSIGNINRSSIFFYAVWLVFCDAEYCMRCLWSYTLYCRGSFFFFCAVVAIWNSVMDLPIWRTLSTYRALSFVTITHSTHMISYTSCRSTVDKSRIAVL